MSDGYIDKGVDCLLGAVGDLDSIPISGIDTYIDSAIAKVLAASTEGLTKYVQMLTKLKTDFDEVKKGIRNASHEIEEVAVRIDNAGNQ